MNVNPKQVNGYEWEIPSGWTVVSGGNTKSIVVKPNNCSGGTIRVRGKNTVCTGNTFYSNWSTVKTITRTLPTPGAISGADQLNCSDATTRTYSISAVTGAENYTWTLPSGWSGTSTTTSINVTPNGLNGGAITVKANGCSIQSSASSKTITINLTGPNNQPSISGSSPVCHVTQPLNGTDFILSNLPQNSTASWTTSSNLTIVSGQGTTTLRVKASSSSTSDRGWVEALITTPCGSPPPIRYNVWAGKPYDFLVNGPTLVQAGSFNFYEMKKWGWPTNNSYASFTEQGIAPSGFTWSFGWPPTSAGWNCGACTGEYNTIQAGSQSTYVTAHVQNTCGTATRNYEVFVQQVDCPPGGCEEPFFVYPNPSSEELSISTSSTDKETVSEITLIDSQGTIVYTSKVKSKEHIKISVKEFKNGLYYLKVNQNGTTTQRQIIINH